jgi:hypothetical protein
MKISGTTGIDLSGLPINNSGNAEVEGNLNLSGTGKRITGDFSNATHSSRVLLQTSTPNSLTSVGIIPNGNSNDSKVTLLNSSDVDNASILQLGSNATEHYLYGDKLGTGSYLPMSFQTGGFERMRIDTAGNVLVTGTGGLGYGTGGTVTQLTSKSTSVTLNKSTGIITMNNAALAAGASVTFTLNNSLLYGADNMIVTNNIGTNYSMKVSDINDFSAYITVKNESAGSLSDIVQINFAIIKGVHS